MNSHHSQTPKLIVVWRGFGVRFHTNACGKVFSLVAVEEGSRFDTVAEITKTIQECRLKAADYEIIHAPALGGKAA